MPVHDWTRVEDGIFHVADQLLAVRRIHEKATHYFAGSTGAVTCFAICFLLHVSLTIFWPRARVSSEKLETARRAALAAAK